MAIYTQNRWERHEPEKLSVITRGEKYDRYNTVALAIEILRDHRGSADLKRFRKSRLQSAQDPESLKLILAQMLDYVEYPCLVAFRVVIKQFFGYQLDGPKILEQDILRCISSLGQQT